MGSSFLFYLLPDFFCGDPLPLEYVMQVPLAKRKKEFLRVNKV